FAYLARLPKQNEWESCGDGAFTGTALNRKQAMRPLVAQHRGVVGVGDVRLDNRDEIIAMSGCSADESDLAIVLAAIDKHGADVVPRLHGDFAFVAWDARARKVVAARDCFGVKPLFYRRTAEHLLLSSRLEPLSGDEAIDPDYVAAFLNGASNSAPRTIWKNALQVEPGGMLVQRGSVTAQSRYWSPATFEPQATFNEVRAVEEFKELFLGSLIQRVAPGETWAQLSGGLDSSAVVSAAEWLNEAGRNTALLGAVTVSDGLGTGDERAFSDTVVSRYALPNEFVRDYWPWRNDYDGAPAPSDEPSPLFPFFARDRKMVDIVASNGGRVLLSGLGADHYMCGSLTYMADMLAQGKIRDTAREVLAWAVETRRSFWHTAHANVVQPLVSTIRNRSRIGHLYSQEMTSQLTGVCNWIQRDVFQDRLEVRYPFLSRRLVEFTLRLPVNMKVRPTAQKYVLREAMRGIVPEMVRTRTHKGGIDARILWALKHEQPLIEALSTDPIIAQMGFVDAKRLRDTVELARQGAWRDTVQVMSALALESWLRARNGAWPSLKQAALTAA
ncbi:MAG TPA: asparagine synthase-related protein, partial [Longimicrobiales bacterium]|nr:asparagine synthase-related protein [Longimicrobiales bacterium]